MKKFSVVLLGSWVLVGSSTLLALDAAHASALVSDVQEIKRDVKQLLSLQGGGAGGSTAAAPAYTQKELADHLRYVLKRGTEAEIDNLLAQLPSWGFDFNYSASGGRVPDTILNDAIIDGVDAATQDKLVAAGARFNKAELADWKGKTSFFDKPFSKGVLDLLAAGGSGAATTGK